MKKKYFILFIVSFIFTFIYIWFKLGLFCDEIWNYGVAYNIANGLVPYRDFNLLTGPLYPFCGSIFIKIFGHHLYSFDIFNSIVISIITLLCYYKFKKCALIFYLILICYSFPNYNVFCLMLFIIILIFNESNIEDKYKDFFIGLLVGLIFITKQSIGICFFLVMIVFCSNRLKKFLSFLIPCLVMTIYLVFNGALFQYFDYCFLGMFDFGNKNSFYFYLPAFIVIVLFLMYKIYKSNFKNTSLLFVLAFQSVSVPLFDNSHFMYALLACLFYLLMRFQEKIIFHYKYYLIMALSFFIFWVTDDISGYHFYKDSSSFMYGRAIFGSSSKLDDVVMKFKDYISNINDSYEHLFIFTGEVSYAVKLDIQYPLSKFDMIMNGNMGYNGANRLIDEISDICSIDSCLFFVDDGVILKHSQLNTDILNYVRDNYRKIDNIVVLNSNLNSINNSYKFSIYDNIGGYNE